MTRMWTPPGLASLTSNRGWWQSGPVLSYVRPLDAALVGCGPVRCPQLRYHFLC